MGIERRLSCIESKLSAREAVLKWLHETAESHGSFVAYLKAVREGGASSGLADVPLLAERLLPEEKIGPNDAGKRERIEKEMRELMWNLHLVNAVAYVEFATGGDRVAGLAAEVAWLSAAAPDSTAPPSPQIRRLAESLGENLAKALSEWQEFEGALRDFETKSFGGAKVLFPELAMEFGMRGATLRDALTQFNLATRLTGDYGISPQPHPAADVPRGFFQDPIVALINTRRAAKATMWLWSVLNGRRADQQKKRWATG